MDRLKLRRYFTDWILDPIHLFFSHIQWVCEFQVITTCFKQVEDEMTQYFVCENWFVACGFLQNLVQQ